MVFTLSEQRTKLVQDWRAILDAAEAEGRALNADEVAKAAISTATTPMHA